jgi:hypothetical protein
MITEIKYASLKWGLWTSEEVILRDNMINLQPLSHPFQFSLSIPFNSH